MAAIVAEAENDEEFRRRLADDTATVLAEHDIPDGAVEEYAQALDRSRRLDAAADPTECIHTNGCADFTCISSHCGPTCFITIVVDPPDA
ncbi:MAG: hypothetical protein ACRD0K_01625 [Egibacteraceae bacterium]